MSEHFCTVCGETKLAGQVWFLVVESHWNDKLQILQWKDELADRRGIHNACCPAHVQELVTQWMTNGDLDFLLGSTDQGTELRNRVPGLPVDREADIRGGREIGELAIDRESIERALKNNPDSLLIILDELRDALERETAGTATRLESGTNAASGFSRQM